MGACKKKIDRERQKREAMEWSRRSSDQSPQHPRLSVLLALVCSPRAGSLPDRGRLDRHNRREQSSRENCCRLARRFMAPIWHTILCEGIVQRRSKQIGFRLPRGERHEGKVKTYDCGRTILHASVLVLFYSMASWHSSVRSLPAGRRIAKMSHFWAPMQDGKILTGSL